MPQIYNLKDPNCPKDDLQGKGAIYIGRPTYMGNEFIIGQDGDRDEVCDKYEQAVEADPIRKAALIELCKGRDLKCFCKPARCHGDYLLRISNYE